MAASKTYEKTKYSYLGAIEAIMAYEKAIEKHEQDLETYGIFI